MWTSRICCRICTGSGGKIKNILKITTSTTSSTHCADWGSFAAAAHWQPAGTVRPVWELRPTHHPVDGNHSWLQLRSTHFDTTQRWRGQLAIFVATIAPVISLVNSERMMHISRMFSMRIYCLVLFELMPDELHHLLITQRVKVLICFTSLIIWWKKSMCDWMDVGRRSENNVNSLL